MDDLSFLHFLPVLPGVVFSIVGLILQYFPPKKINFLYGYRSKLSMSSQELWDVAQRISAKEMIRLGLIQAIVGLLVGYTVANEVFPVAYILVSAVACGIAVMMRTETQLRSMKESSSQ